MVWHVLPCRQPSEREPMLVLQHLLPMRKAHVRRMHRPLLHMRQHRLRQRRTRKFRRRMGMRRVRTRTQSREEASVRRPRRIQGHEAIRGDRYHPPCHPRLHQQPLKDQSGRTSRPPTMRPLKPPEPTRPGARAPGETDSPLSLRDYFDSGPSPPCPCRGGAGGTERAHRAPQPFYFLLDRSAKAS